MSDQKSPLARGDFDQALGGSMLTSRDTNRKKQCVIRKLSHIVLRSVDRERWNSNVVVDQST